MKEAYEIGMQLGINFSFDDPIRYVTEFADKLTGRFTKSYYSDKYNPEFLGAQPARAGQDY